MRDEALTTNARSMRQQPTEPEQRLWLALRARRFESVTAKRRRPPFALSEVEGLATAKGTSTSLSANGPSYPDIVKLRRYGVLTAMASTLSLLPTSAGSTAPRAVEIVPGAQPTRNFPEGERAS